MADAARRIELVYDVPDADDRWVLEEDDNLPESALHDAIVLLLVEILRAWRAREGRDAFVGRNIALRWNPAAPKQGVDPDVYVVEPCPPEGEDMKSLCTWKPGCSPPRLAIEVVSEGHPDKDYEDGPARYAASGTRELWVFDPLLSGPAVRGGPWKLQVWRRDEAGRFNRVFAGEGPARSEELGAWIVVTDGGRRLRIADDPFGQALWPSEAEAERAEKERERAEKERERAEKERERAEKERERAEKEAAEAEVARLREELARLRGDAPR